MTKKSKSFDFEAALAQLETLVDAMEEGKLSLEESLQAFEQGIKLTRDCQQALAQAEQKVQLLVKAGELPEAEPYAAADEAADTDAGIE